MVEDGEKDFRIWVYLEFKTELLGVDEREEGRSLKGNRRGGKRGRMLQERSEGVYSLWRSMG